MGTHTTYSVPVDHPGVFIGEEIEARNWTQRDLAFVLGKPEQLVSMIVSGKRNINAALAKELAAAFEVSPDLFLGLQQAYDKYVAAEPDASVSRRGRIVRNYPIREMIKRGWIEDAEPALLEHQLATFFEVRSFEEAPYIRHAAKKSGYDQMPPTQLAWLFRVRQLAKETVVEDYSPRKLRETLSSLGGMLSAPEEIRRVPQLLERAGVRFIVVEGLPTGKIDGACFWLSEAAPVVGVTTRFDRIDNFWFVLRHELEHVLRGDGRTLEIVDSEIDPSIPDQTTEELAANAAAEAFCVPREEMESFYHRKNPYFSRASVLAFAQRIGVHPGLVVGQLQHRTGNYSFLRNLQVKVRHHLLDSAVIDGWGDVAPVGV